MTDEILYYHGLCYPDCGIDYLRRFGFACLRPDGASFGASAFFSFGGYGRMRHLGVKPMRSVRPAFCRASRTRK